MKRLGLTLITLMLFVPLASADLSPQRLWSYSDTCAVFSMALNREGYIGLAFGYYAELLSSDGKLLLKAPTRGIAYSSAVSDNNVLIIGTEGNWVQAFKGSKRPIWEHRLRSAVVSVSVSKNGSLVVAGDGSGYVYAFRDGNESWERKVGDYVWSVYVSGAVYVGADSGLFVFSNDGKSLWNFSPGAGVRKVTVSGDKVVALVVPKSEEWSEFVVLSKDGKVLWRKRFNGYVRAVSVNGRNVALAGNFGNVTLLTLNGSEVYSTPLIGYAYDVATRNGYTVVSFANEVELMAPNGTVVWFKKFNGTAYHVAFSPKGYFLTEYGSHDVQNCYSVIIAWAFGASRTSETSMEIERTGTNPYVVAGLLVAILVLGALLWRKR